MSAPSPVSHHRARLPDGTELHYAQAGQGPLMLFLHGFPEFWYAWRAQLAHFGGRYRCVAPDQRGFNLSSRPAGVAHYRARHLVGDVVNLLDALGEARCILVAHDWGGAIAWNVAAAYPQRVERLVILNAPHPVPFARALREDAAQQAASAYMNMFRGPGAEDALARDDYAALRALTLQAWGRNGGDAGAEVEAAYRAAWSQPGALTGSLNWYRASPLHPPLPGEPGPPEMDPEAFRVRVPTQVIWGERDRALLPCNLDGLEDLVEDLRVVRIADASHWIVHERGARVNALIDEFLG